MPTQGTTVESLPALSALPEDAILYVVSNNADYKLPISLLKSLILANLPPAEIPDGLLNEDILTARLQDYLTSAQIDAVIEAAISAIPSYVLPETVVQQSDLTPITADIQGLQLAVQEIGEMTYVTAEQLATQLSGYIQTLPANLVYQDALDTLENRVSELELRDVVTPSQLSTGLQGVVEQFPEPAKPSQLGKVYYVNVNFNDDVDRDGSIFAPYASIQDAYEAVPEGSVVLVSPGIYNEYLTPGNKDILIQGYGVTGSNLVEINGRIIIGVDLVSNFCLKDVVVTNSVSTESPISITENIGNCYFENVQVKLMDGSSVPAVEITGPVPGEVSFLNCPIEGDVLFNGAPVASTTVKFKGCSHSEAHFKVLANFDVYIDDTTSLKGITHTDGNLYVSHTRGFGTAGLVSTAGAGKRLSVTYTSLRNNDGTFAPYQESLDADTYLEYVIKIMV